MSIPIRGLTIFRPLYLGRLLNQTNRTFSFSLQRETTSLPFTNTNYAFPLSPQSQIQPEQSESYKNAFLEEASDEYEHLEGSEIHNYAAVHSPGDQAAEVILRMIKRGETDRALATRDECVKLRIEITPNRAFASAAIAELSGDDPESRNRKFIAWWSLTPLKEVSDQLALACAKLLDHPFDLPLLMDFCIVCAKAGCVRVVEQSKLFPHIFRYGNPETTTAFLVKLEHETKRHRIKGTINSRNSWTSIRNLAIRMHLVAGRKEIAKDLYEGVLANGFVLEPETSELLKANDSNNFHPEHEITLQPDVPKDQHRSVTILARELRLLRRIVASREPPQYFERFLAEFIDAYELQGRRRRSRAIRSLREKVFSDGSLELRARWVVGEQMFYTRRRRPLAVLRTYTAYCLVENILSAEVKRILAHYRERRTLSTKNKLDWKLSQKPVEVDWKIWPSTASVSLALKAVLQLSRLRDVSRLYSVFLKHVEIAQEVPKRLPEDLAATSDLRMANEVYYDISSHVVAVPPALFPDPYYFHYFVVTFATRHSPRRGAQVIRDMQSLGYVPAKESWAALAGAYARAGDMRRVLRLLDHLESDGENRGGDESQNNKELPSQTTLVVYNSVLRGFTEAGMYPEARSIQRLMQERGLFEDGVDSRTGAILHRLSRYERGMHDRALFHPQRRTVIVDGRRLLLDKRRAEWLKEEYYERI